MDETWKYSVFRPVHPTDGAALLESLASSKDSLTNLPSSKEALQKRINDSQRAFHPLVSEPATERYLFVIEDIRSAKAVGSSGLIAKVGGYEPFYTYEIVHETFAAPRIGVSRKVPALYLRKSHSGPSEASSLYLAPAYRGTGIGRLLSLGRFLFLHTFPERFEKEIIAELRGYLDADGNSPFWESVGKHFFGRDFYEMDALSGLGSKDFIEGLMPHHPIYIPLLPKAAREAIGQVHPNTVSAQKLLADQGFQKTAKVDIFDAGPMWSAQWETLATVQQARRLVVEDIENSEETPAQLIALPQLNFKACLGEVRIVENTATLSRRVAELLDITPGMEILVTS